MERAINDDTQPDLDQLNRLHRVDAVDVLEADDARERTTAEAAALQENLERRLLTLPTIEQAKGMLMGYYGLDADQAFNVLRRWSSVSNTKLHIVAADLVRAAATSNATPFGSLTAHLQGLNRAG